MTPLIICTLLVVTASMCVLGTSETVATDSGDSVLSGNMLQRMSYFDQELFQAAAGEFKGQNLVVSPITVRLLLTMLMEGTHGLARDQIRRALRLSDDLEITREQMKSFLSASLFEADEDGVSLDMTGRVFISSEQRINHEYAKILRQHYSSDVEKINMANEEEAAEVINSWVNKTTKGIIPAIVSADQISSDTAAILASALYFEGAWKNPFEDLKTACFYTEANKCSESTFMRQNENFQYANVKSLNAQVLELPYSQRRFSMLIMVPHDDINALLRDLPHVSLDSVTHQLEMKEVNLSLPRFTAENGQDITNILKRLQITEAFSSEANFNAIETKNNMTYRVSSILHSSKVIVNQKGTIAAGAATLQIQTNMGSDYEKVTLIVNKPFVFFVRDSVTRMVLFAGVVAQTDHSTSKGKTQNGTEVEENAINTELPSIIHGVELNSPSLYTSPPPVYGNTTTRLNTADVGNEGEIEG